MPSLTESKTRSLIKAGKRFNPISDGDGLYLCWPEGYAKPFWRFRYRFAGKARIMTLGGIDALKLADARKRVKELRAQITLGRDPAGERQASKAATRANIEASQNACTVAQMADEYYSRMVEPRIKHPHMVRYLIDKDIQPALGKLPVEAVKPRHIDQLLQGIVKRGAPTVANDVLRLLQRVFDYGIRRHYLDSNPAGAFGVADAGGKEKSRDRALSLDEIATLFCAMKTATGFSRQNDLTVRLLLLLGCRKMELLAARWQEFDLGEGVWHLPAGRTKTGKDVAIPLPALAVEMLLELREMAGGSGYVLPARKAQDRMLPHVSEATLNVALARLGHGLPAFTIHDFRRTMRSHLGALKIPSHVAEKCLNHKARGVESIYDRHDYFAERRDALNAWAAVLAGLEDEQKVIQIDSKPRRKP